MLMDARSTYSSRSYEGEDPKIGRVESEEKGQG
jgi:hypothetical protein